MLTEGNWSILRTRPIDAVVIAAGLLAIVVDIISKKRREHSLVHATEDDYR
jgi:TctA family transporter